MLPFVRAPVQIEIVLAVLAILGVAYVQAARLARRQNLERPAAALVWEGLVAEPFLFVVRWVPGAWGVVLRALLYRLICRRTGARFVVMEGVKILHPSRLEVGADVMVNESCYLHCAGGVKIGDWVRIAPGAKIFTWNHRFEDAAVPIKRQGGDLRAVEIGEDVWIGTDAVIVPGVRIGRGAVVGAGAVVTRDVPDLAIVAGVPARAIGRRGKTPG
jgi:acetyltransferase-like isoleucine patch superfamily enzyme